MADIFERPQHPYTVGLLHSIPRMNEKEERLTVIPGSVPDPSHFPTGCPFHPRCALAVDRCKADLPALTPRPGAGTAAHQVRCFRAGEAVL